MLKIAKTMLLSVLFTTAVWADELTIRDDAPSQYVVQKGDTLWDISALYLNSPWRWPELWGKNPQIDNPHLIYPGDILRLVYGADGQPRLMIANSNNVVKKSPTKRTTVKRYQPIETLPLSVITPYLNYERILLDSDFDNAPMILGGQTNTLRKLSGDLLYAQGRLNGDDIYGVYVKSREFSGDENDQKIYELELAGTARVTQLAEEGGIHKVKLLSSRFEIKQGYRLIPLLSDLSLPANYTLTAPSEEIEATIVGSSSKVREVSKLEVIILDAGSEDGLETGNVMSIFGQSPDVVMQEGKPVYKEDATKFSRLMEELTTEQDATLNMPSEVIGNIVVFKVYDKVSYALITDTTYPVRVMDKVGMPR